MYKQKFAFMLLASLTITTAPAFSYGHQGGMAAVAYAESADPLSGVLKEAYQTFFQDRALTTQQITFIQQNKEKLLPFVQAGLALAENRLRLTADQQGFVFQEWGFWLEVARQLKDPRIEPSLLSWLSTTKPIPDSYMLGEVLESVIQTGDRQQLLEVLRNSSEEGAMLLMPLLEKKQAVSDQQLHPLLTTYADRPQARAVIGAIGSKPDGQERLQKLYETASLSPKAKRLIVEQLLLMGKIKENIWLTEVAKQTTDPATEQMIDRELVRNHGDMEAAKRLHDSGMQHGFAIALDGLTEKFLAEHFPSGKLSQGIAAYEAIRGFPYFHQQDGEQWYAYESHGDDFANPQKAISQWLAFIEKNPNHPALDDAAYRLARCYQMVGEYERALYWFDRAQNLGDQDLQYDAYGQFLYVLDVNMTAEELARLDTTQLPAWTKGWAEYSLAVEYLRERRYEQASSALQKFIDTYHAKQQGLFAHESDSQEGLWQSYYPFWSNVNEQLALAKRAAQLQDEISQASGAEKAKKQYELAAMISKQPFLYYNHLWRGERQAFFWFGQIKTMDYQVSLDHYIGRFNHLVQATDAFSQINLDEADEQTGAKTLFSQMLMNSKCIEYGEEVSFHVTKTMLVQQMLQYGDELLKRYPESELADDALLLMYHYTKDTGKLEQLLERYPKSDKAAEASKLLKERPETASDPTMETVPVQKLAEHDWQLPANIKKWVEQSKAKPGHYVMKDGEWLYAYMVPQQGKQAYMYLETTRDRAVFVYEEGTLQKFPQQKNDGARLVRLPYRYVAHTPITWRAIGD
ncbi:MAG TPA: tetratricopeptide repeat protein [Candidatus Bathyarchaeia archaeon]|nr:tetratricopeptide repeat protein [Candidatus Bathyarchaeia archaeon]